MIVPDLSMIVAIAENRAIGKDNRLLWHLSADLKRFKQLTTDHTVIMGQNTFESLPNGPLPNRENIVLSLSDDFFREGIKIARSLEQALQFCPAGKEVFIAGGASIYKLFLPYVSKLYLTLVHHHYEADVFFPEFNINEWEETCRTTVVHDPKFPHSYSFIDLKRK